MATKTANVTARIQPEIKQSAEAILEELGIPVSVFIDKSFTLIFQFAIVNWVLPSVDVTYFAYICTI